MNISVPKSSRMKRHSNGLFCFSHQMPFLIGCTVGIALSLIAIPLIEEHCLWYTRESVSRGSFISSSESVDEYEPVLKLDGKPKEASQVEKVQLYRPRYYSTELNIREKLLVAVLTTPKTIVTLGYALNRTLSNHGGKVVFFVLGAESESTDVPYTSVVWFSDKRSVLTPFYMLQHIADHFLNEYDFFFFAKDTTYIREHKLNSFVSRISISQSVHIGESLDFDSLYCSLEAGILLSNNIVKATTEDLDWCIQHAFSDSSSDNFGRCVLHGTQQSCSSTVQGLKYTSHPVSKYTSLEDSVLKSSWAKDLKHAVTVYPVSSAEDHYMLHHYFSEQELLDNQNNVMDYQDKILTIRHMLPNCCGNETWPVGIEAPFKAQNRFDVIPWVYFNETHFLLPNEQTSTSLMRGLWKMEIGDILKAAVNWVREHHEDRFIFQKLVNGYKRFDPTRGTEYVLDLMFLKDTTGKEIVMRIESVRPLNEVEIIPVPFVTEHSRVVLLLVIRTSEIIGAMRFLEDYAKNCLEKQDTTALLIVFLYSPNESSKETDDAFLTVKSSIQTLSNRYKSTGAKIAWLSLKGVGRVPPTFAILDLVSRKLSPDSMILLCRVGMEIHHDYLNRVRMNTIIRTQVFFPIPYVQYHPSLAYKNLVPPDHVEVKKDLGHFDPHSYIHASFYLSDYMNCHKGFSSRMPFVRTDGDLKNEELYNMPFDLYNMFLNCDIHVMRAVEPDLRLRFNIQLCDQEFPVFEYNQCMKHQAVKLASKSQLAASVLSHTEFDNSLEMNGIL